MGASLNKYGCSWNKLFEYMASGNPILCNLRVNYDLIKKYNLGSSVTFKNAEEYADEIMKYYNMSGDETKIIEEHAKQAVKKYDYQNLASKIEKICKQLL